MADKLKITLVKSTIGAVPKHRKTVESMGLRKLNKSIVLPDNAATRGQIAQIRHLIKVEAVTGVTDAAPADEAKEGSQDE
jgi:large subunit ribosomal protein L30